MSHILWKAKDAEGAEVQLVQNFNIDGNEERWNLEVTEGTFSGYPVVYVNREQLEVLHFAIKKELGVSGG